MIDISHATISNLAADAQILPLGDISPAPLAKDQLTTASLRDTFCCPMRTTKPPGVWEEFKHRG